MAQILTELSYRTFDSLLEDVRVDLRTLANSGRIEPQQLIKVAQKVSYDLGLRINQVKEAVLEVNHRKARLPDDFQVMNFGLLCGEFSVTQALPQGTNIWEVTPGQTIPAYKEWVDSTVCGPGAPRPYTWPQSNKPMCLTQCGSGFQLVQIVNTETRHYKYMLPIKFDSSEFIASHCPNLKWRCLADAYIKYGFVHTNFECGNMYINYEADLVDDDGNLLVLDKVGINEYYEFALKERILQNVYLDGDATAFNAWQMVKADLKAARNYALGIANTPNFEEMKRVWSLNRRAYYDKFYEPLASYSW